MAAALAYRAPEPGEPGALTNNAGDGRLTVVIDPGHGGIDPGAVGLNNTLEKDVVLAFSQELAAQLRATGRYEVILTREDDTFLSLNQRVEFARNHRADIFLSIHADSFSMDNVRGMAVYTVSERASNEMAAIIAAGENRADILAGVDLLHTDDWWPISSSTSLDGRRRTSVASARNLVRACRRPIS
jgi:N-acetylmuramoyl-L-alanine amidase